MLCTNRSPITMDAPAANRRPRCRHRLARGSFLCVLSVLSVLLLPSTSSGEVDSEVNACVALNLTSWMPPNATDQVRIGAALTVTGRWEKYAEGYCEVLTMWLELFKRENKGLMLPTSARDAQGMRSTAEVGLFFVIADVGDPSLAVTARNTEAALRRLHAAYRLDALISPYSSSLSPHAGLVADELGVVTLAPGAAAPDVFICPEDCSTPEDCDTKSFNCRTPLGRRFNFLYGSFSPATMYFRNFVSLAAIEQARTIAFVSEDRSFTLAAIDGARRTAVDNDLQIVAEVLFSLEVGGSAGGELAEDAGGTLRGALSAGSWKEAALPFARRMRALDVDVVVGGTYYDSCVGLVQAFVAIRWLPKALGVAACVDNGRFLEREAGVGPEDARWISGPSQWDPRLSGYNYEESALALVNHFRTGEGAARSAPANFMAAFEARWGYQPPYQTTSAMAALYLLEGALRSAGLGLHEPGYAEALKTAMDGQYQRSFWGINTADSFGRNTQRTMVNLQLNSQAQTEIISPISASKAKFVYPIPSFSSAARFRQCPPGAVVLGANRWCLQSAPGAAAPTNATGAEAAGTEAEAVLPHPESAAIGNGYEYCNDTRCVLCPIGTASTEQGSRACTPCPVNTFAEGLGTLQCRPCPLGSDTRGRTGASQCTLCEAGFYQGSVEGSCRACPPGSMMAAEVQPKVACVSCNQLAGYFFQPAAGQSHCLRCPPNTVKQGGTPGFAREECECAQGYWRPDGLPGHACTECDSATMDCPGGLALPVNREGLYGKTQEVNGTRVLAGYPFAQFRDRWPDPADAYDAKFTLPPLLFDCPRDARCLANYSCSSSREGTLCSQCAGGHFLVGHSCTRCAGGGWDEPLTALAWLAIVSLWVGLNKMSASEYDSLDIGLQYMQYVSITQGFSVPWPTSLSAITQVFSVANFDVDFYSPKCIMPAWSYLSSTYLTFLLPPIWAAYYATVYALARLWLRFAAPRRESAGRCALPRWLRPPFAVSSRAELERAAAHWQRSCLVLLNIIYNAFCIKAFAPFQCTHLPDGTSFVTLSPEVQCHTATHDALVRVCQVAIVVYIVGVPALFAWKIRSMVRRNTLIHPRNVALWGWLYTRYEPGYYGWELVILTRRLVLCGIMVFLHSRPHLQVASGIAAMTGFICAQYYHRPFVLPDVDVLDSMSVLSVTLYMLSGVVFVAETRTDQEELIVVVMLLAVTSAALAAAAVLFGRQYYSRNARRNATWTVARFTAAAWVATVLSVRERFRGPGQLLAAAAEAGAAEREAKGSPPAHEGQDQGEAGGGSGNGERTGRESWEERGPSGGGGEEEGEGEGLAAAAAAAVIGEAVAVPGPLREKLAALVWMLLVDEKEELTAERAAEALCDLAVEEKHIPVLVEQLMVMSHGFVGRLTGHVPSAKDVKKQRGLTSHFTLAVPGKGKLRVSKYCSKMTHRVLANGGQLGSWLDSAKLEAWLRAMGDGPEGAAGENGERMVEACLVDQWMSPIVADTSVYGANSTSDEANFLRGFLRGNPYAIDFLLCCTAAERKAFNTLLTGLFSLYTLKDDEGASMKPVASIVTYAQTAPLLHWLARGSTEYQWHVTRDLLVNVYEHDTGLPPGTWKQTATSRRPLRPMNTMRQATMRQLTIPRLDEPASPRRVSDAAEDALVEAMLTKLESKSSGALSAGPSAESAPEQPSFGASDSPERSCDADDDGSIEVVLEEVTSHPVAGDPEEEEESEVRRSQ